MPQAQIMRQLKKGSVAGIVRRVGMLHGAAFKPFEKDGLTHETLASKPTKSIVGACHQRAMKRDIEVAGSARRSNAEPRLEGPAV